MKEKIQKLLRLAESSNPAEAELATARAEELMIKAGIDIADLNEEDSSDIVERKRFYKGSYHEVMPQFVQFVCNGLGSLYIMRLKMNNGVYVYIVGHKSDVDMAEEYLDSLETQATTAMWVWWKSNDMVKQVPPNRRYYERRQFFVSFASTVSSRLKAERNHQVEERGESTALVLADREKRVEQWVHANHNVTAGRATRMRGGNSGATAGSEAGARADIGTKSVRA